MLMYFIINRHMIRLFFKMHIFWGSHDALKQSTTGLTSFYLYMNYYSVYQFMSVYSCPTCQEHNGLRIHFKTLLMCVGGVLILLYYPHFTGHTPLWILFKLKIKMQNFLSSSLLMFSRTLIFLLKTILLISTFIDTGSQNWTEVNAVLNNGEWLPTRYTWVRQPDVEFLCFRKVCYFSLSYFIYVFYRFWGTS